MQSKTHRRAKRLNRRDLLWLAGIAGATVLLPGCGSGAGHSSSTGIGGTNGGTNTGGSGSGDNNGDGGSGGETGGGDTITEQARMVALDAVAAHYDTLPQTSATDDAASLLAFLKTRSEFSVSGISHDNSVWARFTDGRPLVIMLNDFPLKPGDPSANRTANISPTRSRTGDPIEFPESNKFYLVNTRGNNDPAVLQTFNILKGSFLPPNSYQPIVVNGTIEGLKTIQDAGVLYNIGHAGLGYKGLPREDPGTPIYAFGTITELDSVSDIKYNVELKNGEVGYLLEPTLIDRLTGMALSRYKLIQGYFITEQFVSKYWTFSANSLFVSDNCDGATPEAQPFIQACFTKGLSAYVGWDNAVINADANESALFLFDRLLGYNDLSAARQPEHPQQRPFDYYLVLAQMEKLSRTGSGAASGSNLVTSFTLDSLAYGFLRGGKAYMRDFQNPAEGAGNGGILSPTISAAYIDEHNRQLILSGIFGSDPKSDSHAVVVGGTDLTAQVTWSPKQLVIKNFPVAGPGSSGEISVSVRGHLSNKIQITEWRGTVSSTKRGNGGQMFATTQNVHVRGILNELRAFPGAVPLLPGGTGRIGLSGAPDSTCTFDANGTEDLASDSATVSRNGNPSVEFVAGEPTNPDRYSSFAMGLDFTSTPAKVMVGTTAHVLDGTLITHVYKPTGHTDTRTTLFSVEVNSDFAGTMDENYTIKGRNYDFGNGVTIQWGDLVAVQPPTTADTSAARSVH